MKGVLLTLAVLFGWFWLNIVIAEIANSRSGYATKDEAEKYRSAVKIILILLSMISFGIYEVL